MVGFEILLAHLVGDYVVQNDWMALNKTHPYPDVRPGEHGYEPQQDKYMLAHLACTVHCLLYTLSFWAFTWYWVPWWGLTMCFGIHWFIDRYRLAKLWMVNVSGQETFATGSLAPWSVILVDNVFHLLTLYGIWLFAKGVHS